MAKIRELLVEEATNQQSAIDKFFQDAVRSEVIRIKSRREAQRLIDEELLQGVFGKDSGQSPGMIYDPLPEEVPELIPGLLPQRGAAAIVGETNTGKSLISLEICSSLLTGEPLWGQLQPAKQIERVTYLLGEHTCSTVRGLYHRTGLPHKGDFRLIGPEHLHPYKALVIGGVAQQVAIDRLVKWTEGSQVVVFDPLAGFIQGLSAEQDNASMRTLIDAMTYIADVNGAACLILSHMGKPKLDDAGGEVRRTSYAMRGASAQEDALTHVFYLQKPIKVKQQGTEERYDLVVRKFKGNPSSEAFRLRRDADTKRNWLISTEKAKTVLPTLDDKLALLAKIQSFREDFPRWDEKTILAAVATSEKLPVETVRRWIGHLE